MQEENLGIYLQKQFRRAQLLARWSYIGIIVPILGLVFGELSRAMIKDLPNNNSEKCRRVNNLALGGSIISGIILAVSILVVWVVLTSTEPKTEQNTQNTTSTTANNDLETAYIDTRIRTAYINGCIDAAKTLLEGQGVSAANYDLSTPCAEDADSKGDQLKYRQ